MAPTTRLALACGSNLLAAFAGGAVLIKSMGVLAAEPGLRGEAPLALLFGAVIGLGLLLVVPERWRHRATGAFSALAAVAALLLLATLGDDPAPPTGSRAWLFFTLLCVHFGVWTTARGLRSDVAAGAGRRLPWVELAYYAGMIAGLGADRLGLDRTLSGVERALTVDAALQAVAAVLDLFAAGSPSAKSARRPGPIPWRVVGPLGVALVALTAGAEGAFFGRVVELREAGRLPLVQDLWAASYAGPAIAAVLCAGRGVRLAWPPGGVLDAGRLVVAGRSAWAVPFAALVAGTVLALGVAALGPADRGWDSGVLVAATVAGFTVYEVFYLAAADRIGACAREVDRPGLVAVTLGVMGVGAALALAAVVHHVVPEWVLLVGAGALGWAALVRPAESPTGDNPLLLISAAEPPAAFALRLARDRSLPAYAYYSLPPSSACWWAAFSRAEVRLRRRYEADAWQALGVERWLGPPAGAVGLIGLGVGEGLGEVELLRRLLAGGRPVHYCAVDASPELLLVHAQTVRDVFGAELRAGRLRMVAVRGDLFALAAVLDQARTESADRGATFLPPGTAVVATCLGNVLGNAHDPAQEAALPAAVRVALGGPRVCLLIGVSADRGVRDHFSREWCRDLMEPLRYLESELGLLKSSAPGVEFSDDDGTAAHIAEEYERRPGGPSVAAAAVHRFTYRLRGELAVPGHGVTLEPGTRLLLYTVLKYDVRDLARTLREAGWDVRHDSGHHLTLAAAGEVREYAMIAAYGT